jgi:hypothetical protein
MSVSELKRQRDELDRKIKKAELLEGPDLIVISGSRRLKIARTELTKYVMKQPENVTVVRDPTDILDTDFDLKKKDEVPLKCSVCNKSGIRLWRQYGDMDLNTPLYCGFDIPNGCGCFFDEIKRTTRLESCMNKKA